MITFAQPVFLILLVLIPLSIWIAAPRLFVRRRARDAAAGARRAPAAISKRTLASLLVRCALLASVIFALAGMQNQISRNADFARQRTECVRLAQEKIESLRSFTGIASTTSATRSRRCALRPRSSDGG